jgi:hypothetical protein
LKKNIKEIKMENITLGSTTSDFNSALSERLMNELRNAIERKAEKEYKKLLQIIPLKSVPFDKTNKLLLILLNWLEPVDFKQGLKDTLTYWSGMETGFDEYEGEIYPILPTLFLDQMFPFHSLFYIMDTLRDVVSVEEIAIEMFEKGSGDSLRVGLRNLFDMLGKPSGETFRILTDEAIHSENEVAIDFMSGLQSYFTEPVRRPDYIIQEEGEDLAPEEILLEVANDLAEEIYQNNGIPYDDLDYCVEFLTKGLEKYGLEIVDIQEARKVLYEKLSKMNEEERKLYMTYVNQESMNQLVLDGELFNILGPANAIINGVFKKTDHICYRYGGCRMLYCNCFEYEQMDVGKDELEIQFPNVPQWFTGECEKCKRVIPKRCYAIRRPLPQGGWRGTYCSWNCLHLSGNVDDRMSQELCTLMENQILQYKIVNREEMNVDEVLKQKETELLEEESNVEYEFQE